MQVARGATGKASDWRSILALFNKQDGRCPYSGEKLWFGVNASLDHIKPRSEHPDGITDTSNLQWVTKWVNKAKGARSHEEFLRLVPVRASRHRELAQKYDEIERNLLSGDNGLL